MDADDHVPTDKLVKVYIKMRDARAKLKAEFETADESIKEQMSVIEHTLLEVCKSAGADSLRTAAGVVMRGVRTNYWTSDWESMHAFIREHGALDLLERRISQRAMGEFLKANPEDMPKGLNVDSKYTITVRRATNA